MNYIRKADIDDLNKIVIIHNNAKRFLKIQGLPQWQDGYGPNQLIVEKDIKRHEGYVFIANNEVCGYAALMSGIDDSYTMISKGQWDTKYSSYISIHRIALDGSIRGKGMSNLFLCELIIAAKNIGYHDIRIDTHPMNEIMEKVILHTGFIYKGMINLPIPNGERKAYQLLLD